MMFYEKFHDFLVGKYGVFHKTTNYGKKNMKFNPKRCTIFEQHTVLSQKSNEILHKTS